MKYIYIAIVLLFAACSHFDSKNQNERKPQSIQNKKDPTILFIDSQYVPLKFQTYIFNEPNCYQIHEEQQTIPFIGSCYDQEKWKSLATDGLDYIYGYLDALDQKQTEGANLWKKAKLNKMKPALEQVDTYKLMTHGTRSVFLAQQNSQTEIIPVLIRNISTKSQAVIQDSKVCGLKPISIEENQNLKSGKIYDYQEKISKVLFQFPTIKVVNISLGYKKSWIAEDNKVCDKEIIQSEFDRLIISWKNLIRQHPEVYFVVSAGNEKADFSLQSDFDDDLWASISDLPNLILVGSINKNDQKSYFSNFGICKMSWELGEDVEINYPLPNLIYGYKSKVNGTSSAAAIFSGKLISHLNSHETLEKFLAESQRMSSQCR